MRNIYLDNNATTKTDEAVFEEMKPFFCDLYGNPSSMHFFGGQVGKKIDEAREKVASLLGVLPTEIIFTSCGTESNNAAIFAATKINPKRKTIVTSRVEHPAVLNPCLYLSRMGYKIQQLNVDNKGSLRMDELLGSLNDDVCLVSIMWANNETGNIFPIEEIARAVKERGILLHVDAVQAAGKIPIDLQKIPIDMLSISGHKLHAPKGVGVLFVRKGISFRPFIMGGHQERGRRGGTENVPYIIGLGKAAELAKENIEKENTEVRALRDKLEKNILESIPETILNGNPQHRLPNTTNISFNYIEGEAILLSLSREGIHASSGSACTSGSLQPSHVLRAMGIPFTLAHSSVRFSLSRFTTKSDIDYTLQKLPKLIAGLREISPFWAERNK